MNRKNLRLSVKRVGPRKRALPTRRRRGIKSVSAKRTRKPSARMSLLARNPAHDIWVQIMRNGRWHDVDGFSGEEGAKALATVLGRAGYTARVIRK